MKRKIFFKTSGALVALGFTGISFFIKSCTKSNNQAGQGPVNFTLDLSKPANEALNKSGGSVIKQKVIVINVNGSFKALSDICTHRGCNVGYSSSKQELICPCHKGVYDLNGTVLAGPPPAPLKKYNVTKSGNILTISG